MRIARVSLASVVFASMFAATALPALADDASQAKAFSGNCGRCHSLDANKKGPALKGVVGRKAGEAAGYKYSAALKDSGLAWTAETLDKWLADPKATVKGTKMGKKVADAAVRAEIIAFLQKSSN